MDKDLTTRATANPDNVGAWLKLEFVRTYFIRAVTIYHHFFTDWYDPTGGCVKSDSNYRVCKDRQGDVDIAVYQGDEKQGDCGTLKLTYGLEQADQIYSFTCNAEGDTVLLSKAANPGGSNILVYEITVTTLTGNNIGAYPY